MTTTTNQSHFRTLPVTLRAAPVLASGWALLFLALALLGLLGRAPHPWSGQGVFSAIMWMSPGQVSWLLAGLAGITLVACALCASGVTTGDATAGGATAAGARTGGARTGGAISDNDTVRLRVAGGLLLAAGLVLAIAVTDVRALTFLGYLPMLLLGFLGLGPAAGQLEWSLVLDNAAPLAHAVGGLAVLVSGVLALDRAAGPHGLSWQRWARWTRPAVAVSVLVPLFYAVTRIAWATGVPLGVAQETLDGFGPMVWAGLGLALAAVAGAWLTTGLVSRWGEVFWPWLPVIGGRPVPIALALVPGLLVAVAVTSAGTSFWALVLAGKLSRVPGLIGDWAAWAPELLWPGWGVALAVACLGYLGRRSTGFTRRRS